MQALMARHDDLLRNAVELHAGTVVKTTGDGLLAVFDNPERAVQAALSGQLALEKEEWPEETGDIRVRMGLHSGNSQERDGDYFGPTLNRAARIMSAGHGGQVLISEISLRLISDAVDGNIQAVDLGEHRLRDLTQPVRLFQLNYPGMPAEFSELRTLSVYKHNLPLQVTSFIGREKEIARVHKMLQETRLLTLLGPGGTGKTRLMIQVSADFLDDFPDGVWLIELAPLSDPELITNQAADVLGVVQQSGRPLLESIVDHLRRKSMLLLLDNVEHLVEESAAFVEHLLQNCPDIKLMVTGRESLFIDGETTLQIPSLKLPPRDSESALHLASQSEAVQLFVERASSVRSDFVLDEDNSTAVIEIARRLDGIPLALELAAARTRAMSVEQISERLNDRFRLLTGGRRTAVPRQQTLHALIEWSWNLLDEEEKILLRRVSVFSGGWTLESAEKLAGFDGLDVIDLLEQLVSKSLVLAEMKSNGVVRYKMLESIHQFAADRLFEAGEAAELRNRHLDLVISLIEENQPVMHGREMLAGQARMLAEIENLRTAQNWSLELGPQKALELVGVLDLTFRFWLGFPEVKRWWQTVLKVSEAYAENSTDLKIRKNYAALLIHLGTVVFALGDAAGGYEILNRGIQLAREHGFMRLVVYGLGTAIIAKIFAGDLDMTIKMSQEAVEIARREQYDMEMVLALGSIGPSVAFGGDMAYALSSTAEASRVARNSGNPWMGAMAEHQEARNALAQEQWEEAIRHFSLASEMFEAVNDRAFHIICLSDMAHIKRRLGDIDFAEQTYMKTIDFFFESRHMPAVAHQLESFGFIKIARGQMNQAARLLGAAAQLREDINVAMNLPPEIEDFEMALRTLDSEIGADQRQQLFDLGRRMPVEDAIDFAKYGDS